MKAISLPLCALPLCALALSLAASAAAARPATCLLEVDGAIYGQGPCDFNALGGDGSFSITFPTSPYFAYVLVSARGVADGSWNASPRSTHAHTSLGTLYRDGACWSNAAATVCAW